jgi:DNA-binding winged helix-turn-helix (wHTH) protein/Tfp pilus assembly protein PilF
LSLERSCGGTRFLPLIYGNPCGSLCPQEILNSSIPVYNQRRSNTSSPGEAMYEFGGYRVGERERAVYRGGKIVPLPPKAVDVLVELLRNSGRVVQKDALIAAVWPDSFVEEANLTQMIFILRKVLGDAREDWGRIVTAPRRGYSFQGEVRAEKTGPQSNRAISGIAVDVADDADSLALSLYRKGRYVQRSQRPEALFRALRYFRAAADVDGRFGEAFAGIAEMLATLEYVGSLTAERFLEEAQEAGRQAVRLRPTSAHAHLALGLIKLFFNRDARGSEPRFDRALQIAPADPHTMLNCACHPQALGRLEEALELRRKAEELDPFSAIAMQEVGWPLYLLRRYDEAAAQFGKVIELEPAWHAGYCGLGKVRLQQHEFSEAICRLRAAAALSSGNGTIQALLAHANARAGYRGEALRILQTLARHDAETHAGWFSVAFIHVGLGNADEAFRCLERACAARESAVLSLRTEPLFDDLRSDRRFAAMLNRLNVAE